MVIALVRNGGCNDLVDVIVEPFQFALRERECDANQVVGGFFVDLLRGKGREAFQIVLCGGEIAAMKRESRAKRSVLRPV